MSDSEPIIETDASSHVGTGIIWASRLGYAAKGVVYLIAGMLAIQIGCGYRSSRTEQGSDGALYLIVNSTLGEVLLMIIAIGLLAFSLWRIFQAIFDTDQRGNDLVGYIRRGGFLISGAAYLVLAWEATDIAWGTFASGDDREKEWTILLLSFAAGRVLVALVGAGVVGVGLVHFYRVFSGRHTRGYHQELGERGRQLIRWVGGFGLLARGVQFSIVGVLIMVGAWYIDHEKAEGVGETMESLASHSWGSILVVVLGVGLAAYSVYCFLKARYRRYEF